ncbi:unnamed protein product [Mytilus edulis]|uniref:Envelope fusion protein n=1 Tax=Mytilus edulis TaxID=6550 RepID=A0A8S3Q6S3_MYTED|nr:unnamed protein product [Mytilus edulis]
MVHVLKESLTILNISRSDIAENRNSINDLFIAFNELYVDFKNFTRAVKERIFQIERHVMINSITEGLSRLVTQAQFYISHLQMQLNMLSLGHLSPSVISPKNLRKLLIGINSKLPPGIMLPSDPITKLWDYYQILSCHTVLDNNRIFVVLSVPLIDYNSNFEIFKPFNLPIPINLNLQVDSTKSMLAYSNLEAKALGVNAKRTEYILLNDDELNKCIHPIRNFCDIRSPVYRINLSKFCIVALFRNDVKLIENNCHNTIKINAILPMAEYLSSGTWIMVTAKPLRMSINCGPNIRAVEKIMKPPIDLLTLEVGCSANNDQLTLLPYYQLESKLNIDEPFARFMKNYNNTYVNMWKHLYDIIPENQSRPLLKALKGIETLSMDSLVQKLKGDNKMPDLQKRESTFPIWVYIVLTVAILIIAYGVGTNLKHWLAKTFIRARQNLTKPDEEVVGFTDETRSVVTANEDEQSKPLSFIKGLRQKSKRKRYTSLSNRTPQHTYICNKEPEELSLENRLLRISRMPTLGNIPESIHEVESEH